MAGKEIKTGELESKLNWNWTYELPKKEGFYFKNELNKDEEKIGVVKVEKKFGFAELCVYIKINDGSNYPKDVKEYYNTLWCGPLPLPTFGEKNEN